MSFALKFDPKSDDEIYNVLPEGEYEGRTAATMHTNPHKGTHSIKLTITISGHQDKLVYVYLTPAYAKLLKHYCKAAGILDIYEKGEVTPQDCNNKLVKFILAIEEDPKYGRKNVVVDFLYAKEALKSPVQPRGINAVAHSIPGAEPNFIDSDIPF